MTMRLKGVLAAANLTGQALADAIGISRPAASQMINHNEWPRKTSQQILRDKIVDFLRESAVPEAAIETAFDFLPDMAGGRTTVHQPTNTPPDEATTMLLRKQTLTPAANRHFALSRDPFTDDIGDTDDVYTSTDIRYVREALYQTARLGGFIAIIGESGAGKSTIRRDLIDRIRREEAPIIVIEPYVLGLEDNDKQGKSLKASAIADAIIATVAPLEKPKRSMEAKSRQLHRLLKESRKAGYAHILIIEEAHCLSLPTIKHLKRFFELEDGFKKLLGIALIGQPELKLKLSERNHEVREVVQRCEVVELQPLDAQLGDYIRFKFQRIGKHNDEILDPGAVEVIESKLIRQSRGQTVSMLYPLLVNNLIAAAMNLTATVGAAKVTAEAIDEIMKGV